MLFLWKISQEVNNDYDTYSSAVVVASDPESAKRVHPSVDSRTGEEWYYYNEEKEGWCSTNDDEYAGGNSWTNPKNVIVTCIGQAAEDLPVGEVVCASFHAG